MVPKVEEIRDVEQTNLAVQIVDTLAKAVK